MNQHNDRTQLNKARRDYPGAAIDTADSNQVTEADVKARTKVENNNPANDFGPKANSN